MNKLMILAAVIFISLYAGINFYLYKRASQALMLPGKFQMILLVGICILAFSFIFAMLFEKKLPFSMGVALQEIGSFWFIFMFYALVAVLFFDLLRLLNHFLHFFPDFVTQHYEKTKLIVFTGTVCTVLILLFIGHIRFLHPVVTRLDIATEKPLPMKKLNIVAVSDIHLGYTIRKEQLQKYVEKINALKPDIILLVGDIMDRNPEPVIRQNMKEEFSRLYAPLGIFAVTGNHEYIGNVQASCAYLQSSGITMLRDTTIKIAENLYLTGRNDHAGGNRKRVAELLSNVPENAVVILLDHQPGSLNESTQNGIDLHISGHTHNGQFFPINLITRAIYEVSYGYKKKGGTHIYVSSGLGIWGPKVRLGSVSEIVNIELEGK